MPHIKPFAHSLNSQIDIIIAEDQKSYRDLIVPALSHEGINTIAQASDGRELLSLLDKKVGNKYPSVILLDIEMQGANGKGMNGKEALTKVKAKYPEIKVVMLTHYVEDVLKTDFYENGADGFLTKNEDFDVIVKTIRDVNRNSHVQPKVEGKPRFTKREREIIPLICRGLTMKEIASKLGVGEKAVDGHRQRLWAKTNTNSKAEFIKYCVRHGLDFLG